MEATKLTTYVIDSQLLEYAVGLLACITILFALGITVYYYQMTREIDYLRDDLWYHRKVIRRLMEHIGIKSVLDVEQKPKEKL